MCKPKNKGGRRCAAHTRPAYLAAITSVQAVTGTRERIEARVEAMADIARHAATPTGERETKAQQELAEERGDYAHADYLGSCLNIGREMRSTYAQGEAEISHARAQAKTN